MWIGLAVIICLAVILFIWPYFHIANKVDQKPEWRMTDSGTNHYGSILILQPPADIVGYFHLNCSLNQNIRLVVDLARQTDSKLRNKTYKSLVSVGFNGNSSEAYQLDTDAEGKYLVMPDEIIDPFLTAKSVSFWAAAKGSKTPIKFDINLPRNVNVLRPIFTKCGADKQLDEALVQSPTP